MHTCDVEKGDVRRVCPNQRLACVTLGCIFAIIAAVFIVMACMDISSGKFRAYKTEMAARAVFRQMCLAIATYEAPLPLAPYPGLWVPDLRVLYPEYLPDLSVVVSPYHPHAEALKCRLTRCLEQQEPDWEEIHRIAAQGIVYTGYAFKHAADLEMFLAAGMPRTGKDFEIDGHTIRAYRPGIQLFFTGDDGYMRADRQGRIRIPPSKSPIVYIMEQPSLSVYRQGPGILAAGQFVEFIPEGFGFPASPAVKCAFPPPSLDLE